MRRTLKLSLAAPQQLKGCLDVIAESTDWDEAAVTWALSVASDEQAGMVEKKCQELRHTAAYAFALTLVQAVLSRYRGLW